MTKRQEELVAIRIHDRQTETDPHLATVMRSWEPDGPWRDTVTGHPDDCWEVADLFWCRQELARLRELCEQHGIDWEYIACPEVDTDG